MKSERATSCRPKKIDEIELSPRAGTPEPERPNDNDVLLVRRIDWRFLLPNPELNRVLYVGPSENELHVALRRFSRELRHVDAISMPTQEAASSRGYDLVVVADGGWQTLKASLEALVAGGCIYWEIRRSWPVGVGSARWGWRSAERYASGLRMLGAERSTVHWHRPSFEHCKEIIPLDRNRAVDHAIARSRAGAGGWAKFVAGRLAADVGLLQFLTPCISVVAVKAGR